MKTTHNLNSACETTPAAWIGLDWGHQTHGFALQDAQGQQEEGTLEQSAEALHNWLQGLEVRFGGRPVHLGLEASRGAVLLALVQYPWLTIYPINPLTSAYYRQAFTPSGASDDIPDARVLRELVRDHAAQLRPLELQDEQTRRLGGLVELRRKLVDEQTQRLQQTMSLLRLYYPQALALVGKLSSPLAWNFLSRWPDLINLKAARASTVRRFYYVHNVRRPECVQQRLELIARAKALTTDDAVVSVAVLHLRALVDQLRTLHRHILRLEERIKAEFRAHPEADLFRDLPGAGKALAPRLCVAFGTIRHLYPDPGSLQKLSGVAPVREKSGQQVWTHWRWQAPKFLRQSMVEWAGQTVKYSTWARRYYRHMEAKGRKRQTILRALAFKWIRVLWKCWQTHTPYDESRYLAQLAHRKSPYAQDL